MKDTPLPYLADNARLGLSTETFRHIGDAIDRARELTFELTFASEEATAETTDAEAGVSDAGDSAGEPPAAPAPAPIDAALGLPWGSLSGSVANDAKGAMRPEKGENSLGDALYKVAHPIFHPAKLLSAASIRTDGGTQPRASLDMLVIADYKDAMLAGATFPPVEVFYDGENYWLADGFHRHRATHSAEIAEILANIHQGTQRDAMLFSLGANATHGLPRSNEDKRRVVMVLLNDEEWSQWSNIAIADAARVSDHLVRKLRNELTPINRSQTIRKGRDGRVIDTANIGASEPADDQRRALPGIESEPAAIATESAYADLLRAARDPESDEPVSVFIVAALRRHGDALYRGQLEEMGFSYPEICSAVSEGVIAQPEIGKFTLPDHKPQPPAPATKSAFPPPKARPSIESLLKGRPLAISFSWVPGIAGVSVSVRAGRPEDATRGLIETAELPAFPEVLLQMIATQLAIPKKPIVKKVAGRPKPKSSRKAANKKPAKKVPAKRKTAVKKRKK